MKNILSGLIAILCFASAIFLFTAKTPSDADMLAQKIFSDLETLDSQAFFHEGFKSLKNIRVLIHSKDQKLKETLFQRVQIPFSEKPNGTHSLQIDVIENLENINEALIILQFNLFENESKNKIWENSRSYQLTASEVAELNAINPTPITKNITTQDQEQSNAPTPQNKPIEDGQKDTSPKPNNSKFPN